ncbi:hypothetical protein MBLNU230_g8561t1 [Neophaeotheca triangularis]
MDASSQQAERRVRFAPDVQTTDGTSRAMSEFQRTNANYTPGRYASEVGFENTSNPPRVVDDGRSEAPVDRDGNFSMEDAQTGEIANEYGEFGVSGGEARVDRDGNFSMEDAQTGEIANEYGEFGLRGGGTRKGGNSDGAIVIDSDSDEEDSDEEVTSKLATKIEELRDQLTAFRNQAKKRAQPRVDREGNISMEDAQTGETANEYGEFGVSGSKRRAADNSAEAMMIDSGEEEDDENEEEAPAKLSTNLEELKDQLEVVQNQVCKAARPSQEYLAQLNGIRDQVRRLDAPNRFQRLTGLELSASIYEEDALDMTPADIMEVTDQFHDALLQACKDLRTAKGVRAPRVVTSAVSRRAQPIRERPAAATPAKAGLNLPIRTRQGFNLPIRVKPGSSTSNSDKNPSKVAKPSKGKSRKS